MSVVTLKGKPKMDKKRHIYKIQMQKSPKKNGYKVFINTIQVKK